MKHAHAPHTQTDLVQYPELKPGEPYDIVVVDSKKFTDLEPLKLDASLKFEDALNKDVRAHHVRISQVLVFSASEYDALAQDEEMSGLKRDTERMQDTLTECTQHTRQMYDDFMGSTRVRQRMLQQECERVRDKQRQLDEFAKFVAWTSAKYE